MVESVSIKQILLRNIEDSLRKFPIPSVFNIHFIKHEVARQRIMNFIWSLKVSICFTQSFTNKFKSFGMHFSFILGSYFSLKERCGLWTESLWGYGNSTSTHYQLSTLHNTNMIWTFWTLSYCKGPTYWVLESSKQTKLFRKAREVRASWLSFEQAAGRIEDWIWFEYENENILIQLRLELEYQIRCQE